MVKSPRKIPMPDSFAKLIFATNSHLGGTKVGDKMEEYIYGTRKDNIKIFDLEKVWDKLILAARAIAANEFPETITAISAKPFGRKPVLKFSEAIGCRSVTGRFVPGSFTNTNIKGSTEPRLIVVSDPTTDKQAINEAAQVNCPSIAFCNTDADLKFVDIAIPFNNRSAKSIGVGFFILSRLVNYLKNGAELDKDIKEVELFFFRDVSELEHLIREQNSEMAINLEGQNDFQDEADFGKVGEVGVESNISGWQE